MTSTPPVWQMTTLFGPRPALLSHDEGRWSVVLDRHVVAGRSLDEAAGRALRARAERSAAHQRFSSTPT